MQAKAIDPFLGASPSSGVLTRNQGHPLEPGLLVADGCSMVDVPLMSHLLRALPPSAGLLLVGNVDRLPSVGPGAVLRHVIDSGVAPAVRLTETFR